MAKFIEVHIDEFKRLINLDHVQDISEGYCGEAVITYKGADMDVIIVPEELYDDIRVMVATAQGGIPMQKPKQY